MMKINWKLKLTSRKLWAALIGIVAGLATVFGIDESEYAQVAGLVTMAASVVSYIMGEAKVDAARALSADAVVIEKTEKTEEGD